MSLHIYTKGFIQRRLNIFVSNSLQEYIKIANICDAFSTDHSPVFCNFSFVKAEVFRSLIITR